MTATKGSTRFTLRPSSLACSVLPAMFVGELLWNSEAGIGFCPADEIVYGPDYFEKYRGLDASPMGVALTDARVEMVERHIGQRQAGKADDEACLVDIGIGAGNFVDAMECDGFDVCIEAVEWLKARKSYVNPYQWTDDSVPVLTFWDSLEHIRNPEPLITKASEWVFVSMPIYDNEAHCRASKHFKPGEHVWYFTRRGLITWMEGLGFESVEINAAESDLGREGIESFAFKRVRHAA